MSIATMTSSTSVSDYVRRIQDANPQEAVQIALAEAEREKAIASQEQANYRSLAEVEFDNQGRIVRSNLAGLYRLATAYSRSEIVPKHYQKKPDDCFIACQMAQRLKVDPLAYMQNSYIVHGKPGIEAKLSTALLNTSGLIRGRVRFKEDRDNSGKMVACTAIATDAESGEEVRATVTWAMAKAEGWVDKAGSKWQTIPDVMFHYRSATFLIRQFYPEVTMGMQTTDELQDIGPTTEPSIRPKTIADMHARLTSSVEVETIAYDGEVTEERNGIELHPDVIDAFAACTTPRQVLDAQESANTRHAETDAHRAAINELAKQTSERVKAAKAGGK